MDSLPRSANSSGDDRIEIAGVRSALLGHVASPRGVQMATTQGMVGDGIENRVLADMDLFAYTPHTPADAAVCIDGQPSRPVGTLSFISAGTSLTLSGNGPFTSSVCMLSPGFLAGLAETEGRLRLGEIGFVRAFDSERLTFLGKEMFRETIAPGFGGSLFAEAMGMAVTLEIARYCHVSRPHDEPRCGGLAAWQMRRLESYIRANLSTDLTLDELARLLCISVRHLSRAVKQEKGTSVHRWIADCRFREARRLLTETDSPIHEIAQRAAFRSASAFTTAFRAASGFAPGEFRRLTVGRS
jgi:AraC family transcriptional regulator